MRTARYSAFVAAMLSSMVLSSSALAEHTGVEPISTNFGTSSHLMSENGEQVLYKDGHLFLYSKSTGTSIQITTTGSPAVNAFSADGTRVIFSTTSKLTAADTDTQTDIYEWVGGVFTLVSVGSAGGNGAAAAEFRGANRDASHVYFTTLEQLEAADTDAALDLYQRFAGTTAILSLGPFGGNSTGSALYGGASDDGSHVFFGTSDQLTSDDIDAYTDTYEYFNGTVTRVSTGPNGGQGPWGSAYAGNSADGSRVFFQSREALTADDLDDNNRDTYSRAAGLTQLESTGPLAPGATIAIYKGASADGLRVFFLTTEPLLPDDQDVFNDVYERSGGTTTLVSKGPASDSGAFPAAFNGISEDGARVFFTTTEPLTFDDTDVGPDIYEAAGGTTTLVSTGSSDPHSEKPAAFQGTSANGARVFFTTDEPLAQDTNTGRDLYEKYAGTTYRLLDNLQFGWSGAFLDSSAGGERILVTQPGNGRALGILTIGPYARPKGATPTRVALVPAYAECTAPDRVHGPGLEFPSCSSPQQASSSVSVGTPDANGAAANWSASVLLGVTGAPGVPEDSDVRIRALMSDVRCATGATTCGPVNLAGGDDYTGELQVSLPLRLTDQFSSDESTGTMQDTSLAVTIQCVATAGTDGGSDCSVDTTADALAPGTALDGKRAIWQLGQIDVNDGGADGDAETPGDNSRFATQGLFVP